MPEHIWRSGGAVGVLQSWYGMVGTRRTDERRAGVATRARLEQRCQFGGVQHSGCRGTTGSLYACRRGMVCRVAGAEATVGVLCVGWWVGGEVVVGLATMSRGVVLGWRRAVLAGATRGTERESSTSTSERRAKMKIEGPGQRGRGQKRERRAKAGRVVVGLAGGMGGGWRVRGPVISRWARCVAGRLVIFLMRAPSPCDGWRV